jgi:EAL domain-containing protein (putative c-di-GMP-specific phosphodiesterase class I)
MGRGLHASRQTEQLSPARLTEQPVDVVLSQTVALAEPITARTATATGDAVAERIVSTAQQPATAELILEPEETQVAQVVEAPVPVFDPAEFDIQFVPALALETGEIIELELLARWRHPQRGLVSLDLSGKGAAAVPWLLEEACRVAAGLPTTRTGEAIRISVNLPASAPLNDELVDTVAGTLLTSGLTPGALQLEIAARALDADPARREGAQAVLAQLRQLGVRVALDGAGAEIDRLPDFVTLPINAVKIDRSVISLLDRSADRRAVVRSIVELARPHGITVNGTGVETLDQAERLWDLGADEGQGPLFFRPVSEDQLGALFSGDALVAAD